MNQEPLPFFVDPAWRKPELPHTPLLYPFWGNPLDPQRVPTQYALFANHNYDTRYYRITDQLDDAEFILVPYSQQVIRRHYPELLAQVQEAGVRSGKPLLLDGISDVEHPVSLPRCFVLRYGGYRFQPDPWEIYIPPYADDLLERYCDNTLVLRDKSARPVVGFAGWADLTLLQEVRTIIKELPVRILSIVDSRYRAVRKGVFIRRKAIAILQDSPLVTTNIIARSTFSGHAETAGASADRLRKEFINNLRESDYGLDIRGDANASTRLYEMLSLGTVPVIVDTERNFPFSDVVDYASFSLIIDFHDLHLLPEKIAAFHAEIDNPTYHAMQQRAREAFVAHFRVDAITRGIIRQLRAKVNQV